MYRFIVPISKRDAYKDFETIHSALSKALVDTDVEDFIERFESNDIFVSCFRKQYWIWWEDYFRDYWCHHFGNLIEGPNFTLLWYADEETATESYLDDITQYDVVIEVSDKTFAMLLKLNGMEQVHQEFAFIHNHESFLSKSVIF